MENNQKITLGKNLRLTAIVLAVPLLLIIPLIAMQFTNEVKWSAADFAVGGTLLMSLGLGCEFILRRTRAIKLRLMFCAILIIIFFLIWAELAVGIFGSPFAGS
ncbi:hypothetical protein F0919_05480 [Taibaiella lutea]|uniref:Uncharacterized protein n=1 Tax=Taibaiella lutea TaxID=2608001 RepID=A0A5M6CQ77_9BACT|nr:hypothetical protein [Taibaiella lutea]KAA5537123.1 hypothetical protein F0919_05480 [Taibaiella lutea]